MDGCLMQINLETKEQTILFDSLVYPHSIVKMNDQFYVLEALKGEVRCLESDLRLQFPGFLRGMFWNEKLCYVGQSRSRHLAKSREFQANLSMDNGIHIILLDQQFSRFVPLPDDCDVYTLLDLEEKEL